MQLSDDRNTPLLDSPTPSIDRSEMVGKNYQENYKKRKSTQGSFVAVSKEHGDSYLNLNLKSPSGKSANSGGNSNLNLDHSAQLERRRMQMKKQRGE